MAGAGAGKKANWFAIWVSVAVVVVLVGVGGLVFWMNSGTAAPDGPVVAPESSNIDAATGAIAVGDAGAANSIDTYIDFMCPICNQFEQAYGSTLDEAVDGGTATLNIHPISILDRLSSGTEFSTRAANAMYCVAVADGDASLPFLRAMYDNQPAENSRGLTDDQILAIAAAAGVEGIDSCVADQTYSSYVTSMTGETPLIPGNSGIGTPTVAVNGETITLTGDPAADITARLTN